MGTKSIQVPEAFHAYIKANRREGETMADALIRLAGGPDPSDVAGLLSSETADAMHEAIDRRGTTADTGRTAAVERFEADGE